MNFLAAALIAVICTGCSQNKSYINKSQVSFEKGFIKILKTTSSLQPLLKKKLTDSELDVLSRPEFNLSSLTIDSNNYIDDLELLEYNDLMPLNKLRVLNTKLITDESIKELKEPNFLYLENTPNITFNGIIKAYPKNLYLKNMPHISDEDTFNLKRRNIRIIDSR